MFNQTELRLMAEALNTLKLFHLLIHQMLPHLKANGCAPADLSFCSAAHEQDLKHLADKVAHSKGVEPRVTECPEEIKASLDRYVKQGIPAGGFLRAVLANDLKESFARADPENTLHLHAIVAHCYNHLPIAVWGSYRKVDDWLARFTVCDEAVRNLGVDL